MNYIENVYENVKIDEGPQAIENFLLEIYFSEGISSKELARKTLLPVPIVAAIKKEFIKAGLLLQDRGVRLTDNGFKYVEDVLGFRGLDKKLYSKLMKDEFDSENDFKLEVEKLSRIFDERPVVDVTVDQSKCTVETSLKRAVLCLKYHALIGKQILCVGDDDLVSISLGFLLKKLFSNMGVCNTKIFVFDIDIRFLKYIEEISKTEKLPIQCVNMDLRNPVDEKYRGKFDCFFTDPPYTLQGISLFISRGLSTLKERLGLPIFLSFAHKSPDFTMEMQRIFVNMGLAISEITPRFNRYEGAEIIGNSGQMIVMKTTAYTKPEIFKDYNDAIYTGEIKRTQRVYKCKKCAMEVKVGFKEDYRTIEELKSSGCPGCKERIFELVSKVSYNNHQD